jgi:hypothetical protein
MWAGLRAQSGRPDRQRLRLCYILYLLFSKKGATVFSEEYQRVIAATPEIKYRTSIVIWILLALLLLLIGVGLLAVFFGSTSRPG